MRFSLRLVAKVVLISLATGMSPLTEIAPRCFAGDVARFLRPRVQGALDGWWHGLRPPGLPGSRSDHAGDRGRYSRALPLNRLIKLTREVPVALNGPEPSQVVVLPDGDRICQVTVGAANETTLEVKSEALGKLAVPLDCLLGIILSTPTQTGDFDAIWERVTAEPRSSEVAWLMNGDKLSGGLLGFDEQQVKIQIDGKPVDVERSGVVALGFDPGLVNYPRPKSDFMELTLQDGTRLGVTEARIDDDSVLATTRFGKPIRCRSAIWSECTREARRWSISPSASRLARSTVRTSVRNETFGSIGQSTVTCSNWRVRHTIGASERRVAPCWPIWLSRAIAVSRRRSASTSGPDHSGASFLPCWSTARKK